MSNATTTAPEVDLCDHYYTDIVTRTAHGMLGDAPAGTVQVLCAECGTLVFTAPRSMTEADARTYWTLCDAVSARSEAYGETVAQYRSEVAHYGDAWPGAAIEVEAIREGLARDEAALFTVMSIHGMLPAHGPAMPFVPTDDEPF